MVDIRNVDQAVCVGVADDEVVALRVTGCDDPQCRLLGVADSCEAGAGDNDGSLRAVYPLHREVFCSLVTCRAVLNRPDDTKHATIGCDRGPAPRFFTAAPRPPEA